MSHKTEDVISFFKRKISRTERQLNFKNNFDLLIVSNLKIKSMAFEELKENTENIQEQAKAYLESTVAYYKCGVLRSL
jgi:hypothetical protein